MSIPVPNNRRRKEVGLALLDSNEWLQQHIDSKIRAAVQAERERCAKEVERLSTGKNCKGPHLAGVLLAAVIRGGGDAPSS